MIPLHSILALSTDMLSKLLLAGIALILLLAFFAGYAQGFRKVGWKGLMCLTAFGLFLFGDMLFRKNRWVLSFVKSTEYTPDRVLGTAFVFAIAAIALCLILYGVCTAVLRPRFKWVTSNRIYYDAYGNEYEDDTGEVQNEIERRKVLKNGGTPTLYGRFFGGLICTLNTFAILLFIVGVATLVITQTSVAQNATVSALLDHKILSKVVVYIERYIMDYVIICVIALLAIKGYEKGLTASLFKLVSALSSVIITVVSCYLPFSPYINKIGFLQPVIAKLMAIVAKVPFLGGIRVVQQLGAGIMLSAALFVILFIVFKILKALLKSFAKSVRKGKISRTVDGILATVLYFVVGVVVCLAIGMALYVINYFRWFNFDFLQEGSMMKGIYDICGRLFVPVWTKIRPFLVA